MFRSLTPHQRRAQARLVISFVLPPPPGSAQGERGECVARAELALRHRTDAAGVEARASTACGAGAAMLLGPAVQRVQLPVLRRRPDSGGPSALAATVVAKEPLDEGLLPPLTTCLLELYFECVSTGVAHGAAVAASATARAMGSLLTESAPLDALFSAKPRDIAR